MSKFMYVLIQQHQQILQALGQHLLLSLVSVLIATIIALPLAIYLQNHHKVAGVAIQVSGIFQTIPSLALLGLLIPFVGIGTTPSIIALVVYALMPILQNAYTGLKSVDPTLEEVGQVLGMSRWQRLWTYELPIAMPMVISGIRIATVLVIGTATLAALIGAGGLGTYILLGIETNNNSFLIIGAVLSALLALFFSWLIKFLSKLSLKKLGYIFVVFCVLCVGGAGYHAYQHYEQAKDIVLAGKLGSEPSILIHMDRDLIKQKDPHQKVSLKPNFGTTGFLFNALRSNRIDMYPEFTGTVLENLIKQPKLVSHNPRITYQRAKNALARRYQLAYLKPLHYQNGYVLSVSQGFAKRYHLKNISDLRRVSPEIKAGFDPDFAKQPDSYPGVAKKYHLHFKYRTMSPAIRYKAIANHRVNLVDGYTTDPQIRRYHLVPLKDDLHFFPPYQGAPLMSLQFAKAHPGLCQALNKLANHITDKQMREMNYLVAVKHESAGHVARQFLLKHHFLGK